MGKVGRLRLPPRTAPIGVALQRNGRLPHGAAFIHEAAAMLQREREAGRCTMNGGETVRWKAIDAALAVQRLPRPDDAP
jgi:hypothetical protein